MVAAASLFAGAGELFVFFAAGAVAAFLAAAGHFALLLVAGAVLGLIAFATRYVAAWNARQFGAGFPAVVLAIAIAGIARVRGACRLADTFGVAGVARFAAVRQLSLLSLRRRFRTRLVASVALLLTRVLVAFVGFAARRVARLGVRLARWLAARLLGTAT